MHVALDIFEGSLTAALGAGCVLLGSLPKSRYAKGRALAGWTRAFLIFGGALCLVGAAYGFSHLG